MVTACISQQIKIPLFSSLFIFYYSHILFIQLCLLQKHPSITNLLYRGYPFQLLQWVNDLSSGSRYDRSFPLLPGWSAFQFVSIEPNPIPGVSNMNAYTALKSQDV